MVTGAIGNHDEGAGRAVNRVAAALILAENRMCGAAGCGSPTPTPSQSNEIRTRRNGLNWRASLFSSLSIETYAAVPGPEAHPIQAVSILWSLQSYRGWQSKEEEWSDSDRR